MRSLCWLFLLTSFPTALFGQSGIVVCTPPQVELSLQAAEGSDYSYTYAVNLRNISGESCSLQSGSVVFSVSPERAGTALRFCDHCEKGEQPSPGGWITLAPGESVHKSLSWKTFSAAFFTDCVWPRATWLSVRGLFGPQITISTPLLWKPICSVVHISDLTAGPFAALPASASARTKLLNRPNTQYPTSSIPVLLSVEDPAGSLARDHRGCPVMFVELRWIALDLRPGPGRVVQAHDVSCVAEPVSKRHQNGESGRARRWQVKLDAGYLEKWEAGEYTLSFSALGEKQHLRTQVAQSDNLRISVVAEGRFIQRNWSKPVNGLSVDLTLDKDTYEVGSDILLHIAMANFSKDLTVFTPDPIMDPPVVNVVVRDADGAAIQSEGPLWTGHGSCEPLAPGTVVPWGLSLRGIGRLPQTPGTYTMDAVWWSFKGMDCFSSVPPSFIVRSNPVTFRVVEKADAGQ